MIKIILKKKSFIKGYAQHRRYKPSGAGFVILFAVTISAILLTIALGVSDVALKEIKFSTNARDTNEAFFAADMGIECALFHDKSTNSIFISSSGTVNCVGTNFTAVKDASSLIWNFTISGLGSSGLGCAKVVVDKSYSVNLTHIVVTSNGYNNCTPGLDSVERQIQTNY